MSKKCFAIAEKQMRGDCNGENWIVRPECESEWPPSCQTRFHREISSAGLLVLSKAINLQKFSPDRHLLSYARYKCAPVSICLPNFGFGFWIWILGLGSRPARCILPLPFDNCHNAVWHGLGSKPRSASGSRPISKHAPPFVVQLILWPLLFALVSFGPA